MIELEFIVAQLKRLYPEYNIYHGCTGSYYIWIDDLYVEGCRVCKPLTFSLGTKSQVEEMGHSVNNLILFLMKAVRTIERVHAINKAKEEAIDKVFYDE